MAEFIAALAGGFAGIMIGFLVWRLWRRRRDRRQGQELREKFEAFWQRSSARSVGVDKETAFEWFRALEGVGVEEVRRKLAEEPGETISVRRPP